MSVLVIDVSNVNGNVDFTAIKRAGIPAAFMKATEGLSFNDGRFAGFRKAAAAAGVRIGAYHFARPDRQPYSPEQEADHFCKVVGTVGRTDLRPVLDFEVNAAHLTAAEKIDWARKFNQRVKKRLGQIPIFYSYAALIHELADAFPFEKPIGNGLWLAAYGRNDGTPYPVMTPPPWKKVVAHQFTSRGRLAGHVGTVDYSQAPSLNALLAHPVRGRIGV